MNAQIILLATVVGLFVSIWSHDRRSNPPTLATRRWHEIANRDFSRNTRNTDSRPPGESIHDGLRSAKLMLRDNHVRSVNRSVETASINLPDGIVVGEYRAVSDRGAVQHVIVTDDDITASSEDTFEQNVYITDQDSERWYFVRVQRPMKRVASTID